MSTDRLRPLWDFSDIDATEVRLRDALAAEVTDGGRAEVLTQLARLEGFRGRFEDAHGLVNEAEVLGGDDDVVVARVLLERGRLLRLAGDLAAALPLFEEAYGVALRSGQDFIAADAAHMAALAGDMLGWTDRGLELARRSSAAEPWTAMLLNNLGWWHLERREYASALDAYQRSLEAHEREGKRPYFREVARCGVAKALRGVGRSAEAVPLIEQAVAWADGIGRPTVAFMKNWRRHSAISAGTMRLASTSDARPASALGNMPSSTIGHRHRQANRVRKPTPGSSSAALAP